MLEPQVRCHSRLVYVNFVPINQKRKKGKVKIVRNWKLCLQCIIVPFFSFIIARRQRPGLIKQEIVGWRCISSTCGLIYLCRFFIKGSVKCTWAPLVLCKSCRCKVTVLHSSRKHVLVFDGLRAKQKFNMLIRTGMYTWVNQFPPSIFLCPDNGAPPIE